jgi:hypothetical protein
MPKRVSHASGKKSNGHKNSCRCPICMNMMKKKGGEKDDDEKDVVKDEFVEDIAEQLIIGGKKSNGHKNSCGCPICMNMKKKGGSEEEVIVEKEKDEVFEPGEIEEDLFTGGKKSNGHKNSCGCPICMNMKKKGGKNGEPDPEQDSESNITGGKRRKSVKRRKSRRNRKTRRRTHRR